MLVCPQCAHEWPAAAEEAGEPAETGLVVKDANGALLITIFEDAMGLGDQYAVVNLAFRGSLITDGGAG